MQIEAAKSNIALIGYRWTGKTTVAAALGEALRRDVVDTDALVERAAGKPTAQIFTEDGEIVFRLYEIAAVMKASEMSNVVISTGGGVVVNRVNTDMLKATSHVVLLSASMPELIRRAIGDTEHQRPALTNSGSLEEEIREVMRIRGPLYRAYSDFHIHTTGHSIPEIVAQIASTLDVTLPPSLT